MIKVERADQVDQVMSGSNNNPGSEQFSLVSLDKSQKAANSYSSMSRRAKGEADSTLDVNEEEAKEKLAPPKPAPAPKPKADAKGGNGGQKKKPAAPPVRSEDAMDQSLDDILLRLEEFNRSVQLLMSNASVAARNIALVLITPLLPLLNQLLKLLNIPLQFINLIARKVNQKMGGRSSTAATGSVAAAGAAPVQAAEPEPEPEPERPAAKTSNFSDMLELNIVFTDNMKKALYKKKPGMNQRMGAMEEDLVISNAMLAIAECAEFTAELPSPTTGLYAGKRIYDIMSNVTKEDVAIFLGFVKAYPGKYIGKEWKISETFATWLINNAPIAE